MNKANLLAIFLSCLHSYFLSSSFFKKIAVLTGNLTQSPSWALLMSYNYFTYHFLVLPLKKILKIEITTFPLSFHPLFTKALTNSMKVHVWWIRSTKSVPKCLFRSKSDSFANKWTIAKLRSETNFKRNIDKHLLLNLYPFSWYPSPGSNCCILAPPEQRSTQCVLIVFSSKYLCCNPSPNTADPMCWGSLKKKHKLQKTRNYLKLVLLSTTCP